MDIPGQPPGAATRRRAASIKTRIETVTDGYIISIHIDSRRAASIKTRIETWCLPFIIHLLRVSQGGIH